jgi:iron-sulfur cluster assembly accessory protein
MAMTMLEPIQVAEMTEEFVQLTPTAAERLQKILAEKNLPNHGLRVFVAGGGCSGMQYGMAFEGQARDQDSVFQSSGVTLYVDPISRDYLMGASIDFVDNLMGGGFRIENPNAVSTCGCGSSFRTKDGDGEAHEHGSGGCNCH